MANKNFISAGEDKLFGWGQSFNATGKFPVIAKRVWATYKDMMDFVSDTSDVCPAGVILTVVNDTDKDNNGAYFVASCPTLSAPELPVIVEKIGSDVPSALEATNYSAALALIASEELPLGVLIKVTNEEIVGEGEGAKKYNSGFYVVNGVGENAALLYLSTSSGTDVTIDTVVTDVETLKTDVADLKGAVDALPETFVTDVKDASGNSVVVDGVVTLGDYATKTEVNNGLAEKVDSSVYNAKMTQVDASITEKADASNVYTKDEVDSSFVKSENYIAFSQDEKDKLAGIEAGAEVNYIKSVGANLNVSDAGELTVTIPEVEVPFQSVAEGDKVLALNEGVLSSTLSYAREEVEGVDSLVLKGINGAVIGSVPVADFIADGMLESVTPEEGTNNFIFTFKTGNGTTESFKVDFSKYVDTYHADNETIELGTDNTFKVKAGVFDAAGAAATAKADAIADAEGKLNAYKTTNDAAVAAKVNSSDYTAKVTEIDGSISAIKASIANVYTKAEVDASLDLKANVADVYTKTEADSSVANAISVAIAPLAVASVVDGSLALKANKADVYIKTEADSSVANAISVAIAPLATIESVDTSLALKANAADVYTQTQVNDLIAPLAVASVVDGSLALKVDKVDGKGLSTNDFTDVLLAKLNGIAEGAEVNVVKRVVSGDELKLSEAGELTLDLGAYAKTADVNDGLATKLDASAKVNGVSFTNGEATLAAGDIALGAKISPTVENGAQFDETKTIIEVLTSISNRIDSLDPTVDGEYGVAEVTGGNGVAVDGTKTNPQISVKISAEAGNMITADASGVYVSDMRSYWEAI